MLDLCPPADLRHRRLRHDRGSPCSGDLHSPVRTASVAHHHRHSSCGFGRLVAVVLLLGLGLGLLLGLGLGLGPGSGLGPGLGLSLGRGLGLGPGPGSGMGMELALLLAGDRFTNRRQAPWKCELFVERWYNHREAHGLAVSPSKRWLSIKTISYSYFMMDGQVGCDHGTVDQIRC